MVKNNFYVEKRKDKDGQLIVANMPIYLFSSFDGQRLQFYTGERIDLRYWNESKQRVVNSYPGSLEINAYLDKLEEDVSRMYREARILNKPITINELKLKLKGESNPSMPVKADKTFIDYYNEFLAANKFIAQSTYKKTTTVLHHLISFSKANDFELTFESIDHLFFTKFVDYSTGVLLHTNNTIHRHIGIIKWFLRWTTKKGYNKNIQFQDFKVKECETEIIALTSKELELLVKATMPSKRLEVVKDCFCFSCFTGLRYSDLKNLKKSDIINGTIRIKTIKTQSQVIIPLTKEAITILDKYKDYPMSAALPVISNQKMNDAIKEVAEFCGFNEPTTIIRYRGGDRIETTVPKYQLITTHVGRKTFVSVAFERGMRSEIIRQISGHKNPKVFDRYNKIQYSTISEEFYSAFQK